MIGPEDLMPYQRELLGKEALGIEDEPLVDNGRDPRSTNLLSEMRRLIGNSRAATREKYHGMPPDPIVFDQHLGKICGTPVEMLVPIIGIMFESMCFMPPSLIKDIIRVLNKNGYEHVNRCRTCNHFKSGGCYLKGYKQAKQPQDFCSSHSSCTHGSDNQLAF